MFAMQQAAEVPLVCLQWSRLLRSLWYVYNAAGCCLLPVVVRSFFVV